MRRLIDCIGNMTRTGWYSRGNYPVIADHHVLPVTSTHQTLSKSVNPILQHSKSCSGLAFVVWEPCDWTWVWPWAIASVCYTHSSPCFRIDRECLRFVVGLVTSLYLMICVDWHLGQGIKVSGTTGNYSLSVYHYYTWLPYYNISVLRDLDSFCLLSLREGTGGRELERTLCLDLTCLSYHLYLYCKKIAYLNVRLFTSYLTVKDTCFILVERST